MTARDWRRYKPAALVRLTLKPVAFALVAPRHFGGGVAEMFLHMRLLDLRRRGEPGAQRMAAEGAPSFALGQIAANAGGQRRFLHQSGDMFVGQALGATRRHSCAQSGGREGR